MDERELECHDCHRRISWAEEDAERWHRPTERRPEMLCPKCRTQRLEEQVEGLTAAIEGLYKGVLRILSLEEIERAVGARDAEIR